MRHLFVLPACMLFALGSTAQNTYDARILDHVGLEYPCDGVVTPVLRIINEGSATMSSCEIDIWKNGAPLNTFDWILPLPAAEGETRQPTLPAMAGMVPGDELEFRILTVNGEVDEEAEGNNRTIVFDDVPVLANGYTVLVEVETGAEPGDVEWRLMTATAGVVAQGGPYDDPDEVIQILVPLDADACYKVEVERTARNLSTTGKVRVYSGAAAILEVDADDITDIFRKGLTTGADAVDPCTDELVLEIQSDLDGHQTSWSIVDIGTAQEVCSGGPYLPAVQMNLTELCCLPHGCYALVVNDAAGDGMINGFNGGYQLRTVAGNKRIIDGLRNGDFGSVSQITGNAYSFCLPIGEDVPIHSSCDKYWWRTGEYMVTTENPAVSAEYVVGGANNVQSNTTGYEFWFYNPHGGYSFRKFRSHNITDGMGNIGATRTCHLKINNWAAASHIPEGALMNVRIRGRVLGNNLPWGPACRFVRDEALALCPPTKLMDIPGNANISCGQFRQFVGGQRVYARPIGGASQYQWRFRLPAENVEIIRTTNNYILNFPWGAAVADPLLSGKTYDVDVRAFKSGAWCVDPSDVDSTWGDVCKLTIQGTPAWSGTPNTTMEPGVALQIWPNPNRGDGFMLSFPSFGDASGSPRSGVVELFDLLGKRIVSQSLTIGGDGGSFRVEPDVVLSPGTYLVRATLGSDVLTERLVIEH